MEDAQPVTDQPRYRLVRFDMSKALDVQNDREVVQIVVGVVEDGARRLTDSTGVALALTEPFTAQELITGLRDLTNDIERRLA
jgi:hypothetical protein